MSRTLTPEEKREKVAFDLYLWRQNRSTGFSSLLFSLINKADWSNRAKLAFSFPFEVSIWMEWSKATSENNFFNKYKVHKIDND